MKTFIFITLLSFSNILLAEDLTFDQCVHNLYRQGGLELRTSQIECLQGLSPKVQRCQNSLFLEQFTEPNLALKDCKANHESSQSSGPIKFYYGQFEKTPVQDKKTICSITVNSENERELFRKMSDPAKYNWIELLPKRENERFIVRNDNWINRACKEKIKCDTVVISGHFAESFIGESGFEVSAKNLLNYSCGECSDFFKSVKEVFLFGCNTLASKARDTRSVDQYVQILTEDGLPPHHAQRIAARRYTSYGNDYATIMRSVFPNAKNIYGFPSVGPSGKSVEPTLKKYLSAINKTPDNENSIFQKTLGQTGMIRMSGNKNQMCESKDSILQNVSKPSSVETYAEQYSLSVPVAVVDMINESFAKNILSDSMVKALKVKMSVRWKTMSQQDAEIKLCPLILAGHDSWMPKNVDCFTRKGWLKAQNQNTPFLL